MTSWHRMTHRKPEFSAVLDEWPHGPQGDALTSLIISGDVVAVRLPHGFVGLKIVPTQTLFYVEAGRLHIRQVLPLPGSITRDPEADTLLNVFQESGSSPHSARSVP